MAKFYFACSKTIPPLPWQSFALPFSVLRDGTYVGSLEAALQAALQVDASGLVQLTLPQIWADDLIDPNGVLAAAGANAGGLPDVIVTLYVSDTLSGAAPAKLEITLSLIGADDAVQTSGAVAFGAATIFVGGDGDYGLSGSQEADVITLGAGASTVYAEGGNDRVSVGAGASLVDGGEGNDTLTAASGTHMIEGGGGDDTILLESGAATISGGAGDDLIVAQSGGAHVVYMAELGWEEFIFTRDASGALIVTAPDVYGMAQGQDTLIRVESIQINDLSGDLNALFASSAQLSVQEQMLLTPDLARNALVARIGVEDANAPFGDYQSFSFVDTQGGLSALEAGALLRVRSGGSVAWLQLLAPDLLAQYAQDIAITLRATGRDGLYTDLRLSLELEAVAPVYGSEVAEIMAGSAAADNLRAGAGNDVLRVSSLRV